MGQVRARGTSASLAGEEARSTFHTRWAAKFEMATPLTSETNISRLRLELVKNTISHRPQPLHRKLIHALLPSRLVGTRREPWVRRVKNTDAARNPANCFSSKKEYGLVCKSQPPEGSGAVVKTIKSPRAAFQPVPLNRPRVSLRRAKTNNRQGQWSRKTIRKENTSPSWSQRRRVIMQSGGAWRRERGTAAGWR